MNSRIKKYLWFIGAVVCFIVVDPHFLLAAENEHVHEAWHDAKYYCPMHPQVTSDKPGNCPICGMRLVLNAAFGTGKMPAVEGRVPVTIPAVAQNQLNIQTHLVEKKALHKTIETWGRVAHDPELYELQVDFFREEALNYQRVRTRELFSTRGLTGREKIAIQFLDRGLSEEWVQALIEAGVPDRRLIYHHKEGGIWIYLEVRESEAPLVKNGDPVTIRVTSLPGMEFQGMIGFVDGKVNDETGTVRARILITDPPLSLLPHMAVSGSILTDLGEGVIIPEDSPLFTGNRAIVFVQEADTFKPREVTLGAKVDGYYEVKEGLMPGEKVASGGNFFIDSESRLRASVENAGHGSHAS